MRYPIQAPFKRVSHLITVSSLLFLLVTIAAPVWADYVPSPSASRVRTRTTTTGTRGVCANAATLPLTPLAPDSHPGQTTMARPTVYWYVPNGESLPMQFVLEEIDGEGNPKQIWTTSLQSQSGIMPFTLPQEAPALEVDRLYRWQAVLLCNPNRPSTAIVATAEIQRVNASAQLQATLSVTNDPLQKSRLYAENGFWYDAFHTATTAERRSLLDDLIQIESGAKDKNYSNQLRQIEQTLD